MADVFEALELSLDDDLLELLQVVRLEGLDPAHHVVERDPRRPDVAREALVAVALEDLGRDVRRRAALLVHRVGGALEFAAHAEVADLDRVGQVDQNVVEFDVAVDDVFAVDVFEALDDLFEDDLRRRLVQLRALPDEGEQVSADVFHDEDDVFFCFEGVEDLRDELVAELAEDFDFVVDFLARAFVFQVLLVEGLDGDEVAAADVEREVHLPEGAAAEEAAVLVEVEGTVGVFSFGVVELLDELGDLFHFFAVENRLANGGLDALDFDVGDLIGVTVAFVGVFVDVFVCVFAVEVLLARAGDFVGDVVDVGFDVVVSAEDVVFVGVVVDVEAEVQVFVFEFEFVEVEVAFESVFEYVFLGFVFGALRGGEWDVDFWVVDEVVFVDEDFFVDGFVVFVVEFGDGAFAVVFGVDCGEAFGVFVLELEFHLEVVFFFLFVFGNGVVFRGGGVFEVRGDVFVVFDVVHVDVVFRAVARDLRRFQKLVRNVVVRRADQVTRVLVEVFRVRNFAEVFYVVRAVAAGLFRLQ